MGLISSRYSGKLAPSGPTLMATLPLLALSGTGRSGTREDHVVQAPGPMRRGAGRMLAEPGHTPRLGTRSLLDVEVRLGDGIRPSGGACAAEAGATV